MTRSVLDDLGEEITGILAPVSICMALVVVLVKALNPDGMSDTSSVAIATIAYHEKETDSAGQKLGGALLNAIIFMAVIGGMTFLLFLLFKWGCYKVIYGYMAFAMFNVFFFLTGALIIQLLRLSGVHMDLVSFCFLLFNFSVVGILGLFFLPVPLFLKQCYTVWVGICVAYIFTHVPEWTSWVLLVIMALYDLAAVLLPGGPLKILVELAIERQQDLPALVYEARPTQGPYQRGMWRNRQQQQGGSTGTTAQSATVIPSVGDAAAPALGRNLGTGRQEPVSPLEAVAGGAHPRTCGGRGVGSSAGVPLELQVSLLTDQPQVPSEALEMALTPRGSNSSGKRRVGASSAAGNVAPSDGMAHALGSSRCSVGGVEQRGSNSSAAGNSSAALQQPATTGAGAVGTAAGRHADGGASTVEGSAEGLDGDSDSQGSLGLPDAVKLGLGDFIFYSMLVGRAAMYDMMTVFASYLAVIAGLVTTLLLLALARKALPALPVSIALGVLFYFLTRLLMEPVMVPLSLNLTFY